MVRLPCLCCIVKRATQRAREAERDVCMHENPTKRVIFVLRCYGSVCARSEHCSIYAYCTTVVADTHQQEHSVWWIWWRNTKYRCSQAPYTRPLESMICIAHVCMWCMYVYTWMYAQQNFQINFSFNNKNTWYTDTHVKPWESTDSVSLSKKLSLFVKCQKIFGKNESNFFSMHYFC